MKTNTFVTPLILRLAGLLALLGMGILFSLQMDKHPHDGWCGYKYWFLALWASLLLWSFFACGQRRTVWILTLLAIGSALASWGALQQGVTTCLWGDVGNVAFMAAGVSCFAWVLRRYLMEWRASARSCRVVELVLLPALLLTSIGLPIMKPTEEATRARLKERHPYAEHIRWYSVYRQFQVSYETGRWFLYNAYGEDITDGWD